jgi:type IV pilus assembly protein PilC
MKQKQNVRRFTAEETAAFFGRLGMILDAGISIQEGIGLLRDGENDSLYTQMEHNITEQRMPLHKALENSGRFRDYAVRMVAVGEMTGRLDEVCHRLSEYYAQEATNRQLIRNTLLYPAVLAGMLAAVLFVLVTEVLPIFNRVFAELGMEMTGISAVFLRLGKWAGVALVALLAVCAAVVVIILLARRGASVWQNFLEKSFLTRRLYEKISIGRLASSLALAMASGKNTDEAVEVAGTMTTHKGLLKKLRTAQQAMKEGANLARALGDTGILTPLQTNMLAVGIKAGQTDSVLAQLAQSLDEEAELAAGRMISLVEPILVSILSALVGLILLSVLLPLLGVMSSIG